VLLFPPEDVTTKQHEQPTPSEEDETAIEDLFADLTGT
jgi:predicted small lipoprotein YifL